MPDSTFELSETAAIPTVLLNNGVQMPQLGFGVASIEPRDTLDPVKEALKAGYRLIDTAAAYGNEQEVGQAISSSGISRQEIFITTKLQRSAYEYDSPLRAFDDSLERLGLDSVDLYLIHWPLPKLDHYVQTWRALERIYADGRARAIGVSNFTTTHLDRLLREADIPPTVNQVELHPGFAQNELRTFDDSWGIVTEAWSPIGRGGELLQNPSVVKVAERCGRSPAQVVLRWHIQLGVVAIPRATNLSHMQANLRVFDFDLSHHDMTALSDLESPGRVGPDPDIFGYEW